MDPNDLHPSSVEDEQCTKDNSNMMTQKSESENESNHLTISINKKSTQSNDNQSTKITRGARSRVQKECSKVPEDRSSVCRIGQSSASNITLTDDDENTETSQAMLSFTSTDAVCGSSSSEDVSDLEPSILELPPSVIEQSDAPSTSSFPGSDLNNESQKTACTFTTADGSSRQADSNLLNLPEICNSLDAFNLPLPKGMLSGDCKSKEFQSMCISGTLASDKALGIEEPSSNKSPITASPVVGKAPSNMINESETPEISHCCTSSGFYDNDCNRQKYCQKEDKSVRRKVKTAEERSEVTVRYHQQQRSKRKVRSSTKDCFSSSASFDSSISDATRNVGRSLLEISQSVEQTPAQGDDGDFYFVFGKSDKVEYLTPRRWVKELLPFCHPAGNAYATPGLDTEKLLKDVHRFFQSNQVDADETLSSEESVHRINTSKYFSDEFSRSHGLLSMEELQKERMKEDFDRCSPPPLINARRQDASFSSTACERTKSCTERSRRRELLSRYENSSRIPYEGLARNPRTTYTDYLAPNRKLSEYSLDNISSSSSKDWNTPISDDMCIESSEKPSRESKETSNVVSSSKKENMPLNDDSAIVSSQTHSRESKETSNVVSSSKEGNMLLNDDSAIESSQTHSRESKETSNVVSESDSNVLNSSIEVKSEPCNENTGSLTGKETKELESSNEQGTAKEGSNVSTEDLDSKEDRAVISED